MIRIDNGVARHPLWRMAEPINLHIEKGEQIAIVGDNASGKSRLAEVLTGHYPLLQNEVHYAFPLGQLRYISFRDSYGDADSGYYYQQRWNQHDIPDDTPMVKIGDEEKPLIALSSGEMRRYRLSLALASQPRAIIIDNPFIGLDAKARDDFRHLLSQLVRSQQLLVILIVSRPDDIPDFITHVLPVERLRLLPKMTIEAYRNQTGKTQQPMLSNEVRELILRQPIHDVSQTDFYPARGGEILRFRDVSIRYGDRTILKSLNWTVHEGERWALSGPNGSGKSTLLSLVCADNPQAYACNIELFGHRRGTGESIWEIKRHIGYVSPEMHRAYLKDIPSIDVVASGLSDSVGLYVRPKPEQKQTCMDWMRIFGVDHLAEQSFLQLSSGEQRLCLLARAFVKDPELLILDEPLHGLDDRRRQLVRQIISIFCQRPHKTLVMVSHYEEEFPDGLTHRLNLQKA